MEKRLCVYRATQFTRTATYYTSATPPNYHQANPTVLYLQDRRQSHNHVDFVHLAVIGVTGGVPFLCRIQIVHPCSFKAYDTCMYWM